MGLDTYVVFINALILVISFLLGVSVNVTRDRPFFVIATSLVYAIISSWWFGVPYLVLPACITAVVCLFSSHLNKHHDYRLQLESLKLKFREEPPTYEEIRWKHFSCSRDIWDPVVYTNFFYLISGLCSYFMFNQQHLAILQVFTFLSSFIYHCSNEANYFNLDQIFATALGVVFGLSLYDAWSLDGDYLTIGVFVGAPLAVALFGGCGNPKDVVYTPFCCIRRGRYKYDWIHSIWHVISACATFACSHFYHKYAKEFPDTYVMGRGYFDSQQIFPIVPVVSLLISFAINVLGNIAGIMPMK